MGDRPTEETLANLSRPATATRAALYTTRDTEPRNGRYDVGLPGVDEPITFRLRNPQRIEIRHVYIDAHDRCQLVAMTHAGEEFHTERVSLTYTAYGREDEVTLTEATAGGHPIGVIDRLAVRCYQPGRHMPEWLVSLADYVRP